MGNEQSRGGPPSSSSGVSSSLSFLTRARSTVNKSPIVVVNARGTAVGNPEDDENLKKLKEIPRFHPLLKSVLPGQRDPQSVFTKIDSRYISRFVHRLQQHFSICYETVSSEQTSLLARISESDHKTNTLFRRISLFGKKYDGLTNDLKKIQSVSTQLESIQLNMDGIMRDLEMLNNLLPENQRLPELPKLPISSTTPHVRNVLPVSNIPSVTNIQTELATDVLSDGAIVETQN